MAQRKVAVKKNATGNKRGPKAKAVQEEKPKIEVEENSEESDDQEDVNLDSDSDAEAENGKDFLDSEAEESDADDDEEEEENDNNEPEPGEIQKQKSIAAESDDDDDDDEDNSDEEPVEAPIAKKEKKNSPKEPKSAERGIPKVAVGRIPVETPKNQIVFVTNLPIRYKHVELIGLLTKYGPISMVNRVKTKAGGNNAMVAFKSPKAAEAIVAAGAGGLTFGDSTIKISWVHDKSELNKRTIVVGLAGPQATKESIIGHFKSCGSIESVTFSNNRNLPTVFVRFESIDSVPKSLELHGSELNSRFITVREETYKAQSLKSPKCTLTIANTGNHESYKSDAIEKIFKKYGELVDVDVVCTRSVLGFVTFKDADQAEKALSQLNGKTVGDLELKLTAYEFSSSARTTLVINLAPDVTEEKLNSLFSECGEIESIKMLPSKAIIKFTTDEAFCKSFLLNERVVHGQPIFVEPNSILKYKLFKNKGVSKVSNFKKQPANFDGRKPFNKFNNKNNNNNNNNNNNDNNKRPFNKAPFNKRPAQNGSKPQFNKKPRFA